MTFCFAPNAVPRFPTPPGSAIPAAGVTCPYCDTGCHVCAYGGLDGIKETMK